MAATAKSVFETVDLTEREWYDYDDKESREVSITDLKSKIIQCK